MCNFKRGLSADLVESLNEEYERGGWWKALADDPQLFIAVRDDYLNVYWKGNSLLRLFLQNGRLVGEVHYKYMLRPEVDGNPYLKIEGGKVQSANPAAWFLSDISSVASLKRAADVYAGEEKAGVHKIVMSNHNIIDVEIAFGTENEQSGAKVAQRIDFAALRLESHGPELKFYEAKRFNNPELRADGEHAPSVIGQLKKYKDFLRSCESELITSYRKVCGNLVSLSGIKEKFASMDSLLTAIANGERALSINPDVRLAVFGYNRDQGNGDGWKPHRAKLETCLESLCPQAGALLLMKGEPKGFTTGISSPPQ